MNILLSTGSYNCRPIVISKKLAELAHVGRHLQVLTDSYKCLPKVFGTESRSTDNCWELTLPLANVYFVCVCTGKCLFTKIWYLIIKLFNYFIFIVFTYGDMVTGFTSICLSRFGFRFSNLNVNQKTNFKYEFQSSYFENRKTISFFVLSQLQYKPRNQNFISNFAFTFI